VVAFGHSQNRQKTVYPDCAHQYLERCLSLSILEVSDLRSVLNDAVGHKYRITRELTGGGMARVFLGEEVALEREVVLKVLSPDLMDEMRIDRFRHEVMQTARLQHPTIVPLLEVGTVPDPGGRYLPYYVMPYVRGESLRSRLRQEGRLSTGTTLRVLRGVLDALAHAHAHGVIHRDVKPENIFLSGTSTVLADFGIAKAIAGPGSSTSRTSEGIAVGTPAYMAPEQLMGTDAVDHRADLYAAGVLAYEMLVGDLPYGGRDTSTVAKLKLHARGGLRPLRSIRTDVPGELASIIEACLAFDPNSRPQSAERMLRVLEGIPITPSADTYRVREITAAKLLRRPRLVAATAAVLAAMAAVGFYLKPVSATRTTDRELAVLFPEIGVDTGPMGEQLFHALVSTLSPIAGLRLAGHVSVEQMVAQGFTSAQIRDSLRAQGFDSALVMRARPSSAGGYMLSLELQRLEAGTADELIAGPVSLASLSAMQPDSVRSLVRSLAGQAVARLRLSSTRATVPVLATIDAWSAWSRGRDAYASRSPMGLATAIGHFERAIALDSTYAQAYADLAQTLALSLFYKYSRDHRPYETAARALRLTDRALELQPSLGEAHLARGYLGSVAGAPVEFIERSYADARRNASANPYSRTWYPTLLAARGRFDEAVDVLEEEVRLDQRSPAQRIALSLYALPAKRHLIAMREAAAARKLVRDIPLTAQVDLLARLQLGGRAAEDCSSIDAGPYLGMRAICLERSGQGPEGQRVVDSLFNIIAGEAPRDSTFDMSLYVMELATYYAARGERDSARQWLRQAIKESPAAIDMRLFRAGYFDADMLALGDSLRVTAWRRVTSSSARARDR
jgi:serine/threonine protein kinase/tetratricopeptide (TPR) repeat protein